MTVSPRSIRSGLNEWPTDDDLQQDVREELEWALGADISTIGVSVARGVVHLDGQVRSAAEDSDVRKAVLRVRGVVGIIDRLSTAPRPAVGDEALLDQVLAALRTASGVPTDVRPTVHEGLVTLTGTTPWPVERDTARRVVERLSGVRGVLDDIQLTPRPSAMETERRIRQALLRNAVVDANTVEVRVDGSEVILEGSVRSYAERQQAAIAAWASPHVTQVHNRIHIAG